MTVRARTTPPIQRYVLRPEDIERKTFDIRFEILSADYIDITIRMPDDDVATDLVRNIDYTISVYTMVLGDVQGTARIVDTHVPPKFVVGAILNIRRNTPISQEQEYQGAYEGSYDKLTMIAQERYTDNQDVRLQADENPGASPLIPYLAPGAGKLLGCNDLGTGFVWRDSSGADDYATTLHVSRDEAPGPNDFLMDRQARRNAIPWFNDAGGLSWFPVSDIGSTTSIRYGIAGSIPDDPDTWEILLSTHQGGEQHKWWPLINPETGNLEACTIGNGLQYASESGFSYVVLEAATDKIVGGVRIGNDIDNPSAISVSDEGDIDVKIDGTTITKDQSTGVLSAVDSGDSFWQETGSAGSRRLVKKDLNTSFVVTTTAGGGNLDPLIALATASADSSQGVELMLQGESGYATLVRLNQNYPMDQTSIMTKKDVDDAIAQIPREAPTWEIDGDELANADKTKDYRLEGELDAGDTLTDALLRYQSKKSVRYVDSGDVAKEATASEVVQISANPKGRSESGLHAIKEEHSKVEYEQIEEGSEIITRGSASHIIGAKVTNLDDSYVYSYARITTSGTGMTYEGEPYTSTANIVLDTYDEEPDGGGGSTLTLSHAGAYLKRPDLAEPSKVMTKKDVDEAIAQNSSLLVRPVTDSRDCRDFKIIVTKGGYVRLLSTRGVAIHGYLDLAKGAFIPYSINADQNGPTQVVSYSSGKKAAVANLVSRDTSHTRYIKTRTNTVYETSNRQFRVTARGDVVYEFSWSADGTTIDLRKLDSGGALVWQTDVDPMGIKPEWNMCSGGMAKELGDKVVALAGFYSPSTRRTICVGFADKGGTTAPAIWGDKVAGYGSSGINTCRAAAVADDGQTALVWALGESVIAYKASTGFATSATGAQARGGIVRLSTSAAYGGFPYLVGFGEVANASNGWALRVLASDGVESGPPDGLAFVASSGLAGSAFYRFGAVVCRNISLPDGAKFYLCPFYIAPLSVSSNMITWFSAAGGGDMRYPINHDGYDDVVVHRIIEQDGIVYVPITKVRGADAGTAECAHTVGVYPLNASSQGAGVVYTLADIAEPDRVGIGSRRPRSAWMVRRHGRSPMLVWKNGSEFRFYGIEQGGPNATGGLMLKEYGNRLAVDWIGKAPLYVNGRTYLKTSSGMYEV